MNVEQKPSSPARGKAVHAALLSALVIPGAGQIYNRCWGKGFALLILFLVCSLAVLIPITLAVAGYYLCMTAGNVDNAAKMLQPLFDEWIHLAILAIASVGIYIYSIVEAYRFQLRQQTAFPSTPGNADE